jgi:hypothetical protein
MTVAAPHLPEEEYQYRKYRRERMRRIWIVITLAPAFIGFMLVLYRLFDPYALERFGLSLSLTTLVFFAVSGASFLMFYLQTGFKSFSSQDSVVYHYKRELDDFAKDFENISTQSEEKFAGIHEELDAIKDHLSRLGTSADVLTQSEKESVLKNLESRLKSETSESILSELKDKIADTYAKDTRIKTLTRRFNDTLSRLNNEVSALSRRGNLNLVLGIITTVAGLVILGYYVFQDKPTGDSPWIFTSHFIPRLTLVVFIETFAYFFLRLYKASLSEIKYFQNEMTNVECKFISLETAIASGDETMCGTVIEKLSGTERNFVLNKGQTTLDLEKSKLEKDNISEISQKLINALSKNL